MALVPNSFQGVANFDDRNEADLYVLDGGLSGLYVPFRPHLVKKRNVTTILAVDAVRS